MLRGMLIELRPLYMEMGVQSKLPRSRVARTLLFMSAPH